VISNIKCRDICRGWSRPSPVLLIRLVIIVVGIFVNLHAENPDTTLLKLDNQRTNIEYVSEAFGINPDFLKAIVYVERTNNYNWRDEYFDDYLAKKGQNSSIGFCQVKMKTAYWIECQLADSTSEFYPGKKYKGILPISQSPQEIIDKLEYDRTNLLYASAYMRIIQSYWESRGYSIDDRVDIIATIFSYGIFSRSTGEPLKPNSDPKPNWFGEQTLDIYKMFILHYPINHK
jgi:hypothetical protein